MNSFTRCIRVLKRITFKNSSVIVNKAFNDKYLLYTNVGISVTLSGAGDILEQHYEIATGQLPCWQATRTRNMTISGSTVGVVCHFWYKLLDKYIAGRTIRIVFKKIFIDQLIGSPLCISTFFITLAFLERATYCDFVKEIKYKAWRLYYAEWMIWPPAQFVNFYVLPPKYRVLFDNTISLGYDVYTSKVKHVPVN